MAVSLGSSKPIEFVNSIIDKIRENLKQKKKAVFINFDDVKPIDNCSASENIWDLLKYTSDILIQKRVEFITIRFNYLVPTILNKIKGTLTNTQTQRSKSKQIAIKMVDKYKITEDFEKMEALIKKEPQYYILNAMYIILPEKRQHVSRNNSLELDTYDPANYPVFDEEPKLARSVSMHKSFKKNAIPNIKHNVDDSDDDTFHTYSLSPPTSQPQASTYKTSAEAWSEVQKIKQMSQLLQPHK